MEVSYRRRFHQSYMIIEGGHGPEEWYELTMLAYNRIPGLLMVETEISDGKIRLWYDITGKQSLTDYLARREADRQLLELLLQGMEAICRQIEDYLLEESQIVLEPEYLYLDLAGKKVGFVYLPGYDRDIRDSFRELMELLLRRLDHGDKQGSAMAYEMYQLSLQKELSFQDMIGQAETARQTESAEAAEEADGAEGTGQMSRKNENKELRENFGESLEQPGKPFQPVMVHSKRPGREASGLAAKLQEYLGEKGWRTGLRESRRGRGRPEEELPYVTVAEAEEEVSYPTEILSIQNEVQGILKYQGKGGQQDIVIDKDSFLVGKEPREVDGLIAEKSVSRVHARISKDDEDYYLEDMNSTNGTYLNGEQLEYRQRVKLEARDRIMFGAEEYIFL